MTAREYIVREALESRITGKWLNERGEFSHTLKNHEAFLNGFAEEKNKELIEILTDKDSNNAGKILLTLKHLNK